MYCPNCDMPRPNDPYFCSECGTRLLHSPQPKKGRLWPPILFLAIMLTIGIALFVLTAEDAPSPSATPWFSLEDGALCFDADVYTGDGHLVIPSTIDGQPVQTLSEGCFENCSALVTVSLPDTLTAIDRNAFSGCTNLRGIKLTEQIQFIGDNAFAGCLALEAIYVPHSVESVAEDAFQGCPRLQHIFYAGNRQEWIQIYPYEINSDTEIYAVSGPNADTYAPI